MSNIGNDKKVYIIHSPDYSIEDIKRELEEEKYPYNFHFDRNPVNLYYADEVWTFGDCSKEHDFIRAKMDGMSIWVMG